MRRAFSLVFWIYLALSCNVMFTFALAIFLVTLPFDRNGRVLHLFSCFWATTYFWLNPFWRLRIEGVAKADRRRPYVIVANHQSLADILVLFGTYLPFKWVSKASVFRVPFIGWNMALNRYVSLVRGDKASIEKMMDACMRWLRRGVSVMMFPEGTRSPDGRLQAFKLGAFRMAKDAGVPVLPVVVDGTSEALPKHGFVIRGSADCRVRVLDPIDVAPYPSAEEAAAAVRDVMARELDAMRGTSPTPR